MFTYYVKALAIQCQTPLSKGDNSYPYGALRMYCDIVGNTQKLKRHSCGSNEMISSTFLYQLPKAKEGKNEMKCPRCRSEMKRRKFKANQYMYICPKCNYKETERDDNIGTDMGIDKEYLEAYTKNV